MTLFAMENLREIELLHKAVAFTLFNDPNMSKEDHKDLNKLYDELNVVILHIKEKIQINHCR